MTSSVDVRSMRIADVAALAGVLARAYPDNQDFTLRLRLYLELERVATFVAVADGEPVGMVVGNDYGPCVYVGMMGVEPRLQRQGIASALMEALVAWADARGAWCELDATAAGAPLYRRFGFVDRGETHVYEGRSAPAPAQLAARAATAADLDRVCALDRAAFGADRGGVLRSVAALPSATVWLADDAGEPAAYAIAQRATSQIGPVVARTPAAAALVFAAARGSVPSACRFNVVADTPAAVALARSSGFTFARALAHMVRGEPANAERERLYGRINLGQG
jgi:predicted N-acetyltransferase YhbS